MASKTKRAVVFEVERQYFSCVCTQDSNTDVYDLLDGKWGGIFTFALGRQSPPYATVRSIAVEDLAIFAGEGNKYTWTHYLR